MFFIVFIAPSLQTSLCNFACLMSARIMLDISVVCTLLKMALVFLYILVALSLLHYITQGITHNDYLLNERMQNYCDLITIVIFVSTWVKA